MYEGEFCDGGIYIPEDNKACHLPLNELFFSTTMKHNFLSYTISQPVRFIYFTILFLYWSCPFYHQMAKMSTLCNNLISIFDEHIILA